MPRLTHSHRPLRPFATALLNLAEGTTRMDETRDYWPKAEMVEAGLPEAVADRKLAELGITGNGGVQCAHRDDVLLWLHELAQERESLDENDGKAIE